MRPEIARPADRDALGALGLAGETLAERLPGLMVDAERVAASVSQGAHGRRRPGQGEAFWQYRTYQHGDTAGAIDWRQSARSRHLFVREQEWEAAESVWLWIDRSPSMRFRSGSGLPFKHERALLLGLALASLLVRGGERVALLGSGARPAGGRFGLQRLGEQLALTSPDDELPPVDDLPRHSRLVIISDLLAPLDRLAPRLARIGAGGVAARVLQIADPAEEDLPFEGRALFEGLEGEGEIVVGNVGALRQAYRDHYAAHRDTLRHQLGRLGWLLAVHRTHASPESGLLTLHAMLAPARG